MKVPAETPSEPRSPDIQWYRWQQELTDLDDAIRAACLRARWFLDAQREGPKVRRGKRRLPRRAVD
jgi:hypothetical protein